MTVTWNPADVDPHATLINANLTCEQTSGSADGGARATMGHATGKWYIEFHSIVTGGLRYVVGFGTLAQSLGNQSLTTAFNASPGLSITELEVAVDIDAGQYWTRQSGGGWSNGGDPATGSNGTSYTGAVPAATEIWPLCIMIGFFATATTTISAESGGFNNAPPAGFAPWDSTPPPDTKRSYATVMS